MQANILLDLTASLGPLATFIVTQTYFVYILLCFISKNADVDKDKIFVHLKITLVDQTAVMREMLWKLTSLTVSSPTPRYCSLTEAETQVELCSLCEANLYTLHTLLETFHC